MTDIAPLGPAIRGTIESNMQEAKDKLMSVWHMLRCDKNERFFLKAMELLDKIAESDMDGESVLVVDMSYIELDVLVARNGYTPL